jgi:hypothetical protein
LIIRQGGVDVRVEARHWLIGISWILLLIATSAMTISPVSAEVCDTCVQFNSGALGDASGEPTVTCEFTPDYSTTIPPYDQPALTVGIVSKDDSGGNDPPRIGSITWANGVGDGQTVNRNSIPGLSPVQTDVDFTQENLGEQWVIAGPPIPEDPTGVQISIEVTFIDGGGGATTPSDALVGCSLLNNVDQANPVFGSALLAISAPGTNQAVVAPPCVAGGLGTGAVAVNGNIDVNGVSGPDQFLAGTLSTGATAQDLTGAASRTVATDTNCVDPGPNLMHRYDLSAATTWLALEMVINPGETTVAELTSLNASRYEDGTMIRWRTGFEKDNVGFNVYREVGGRRRLLNPSLVAGSMLAFGDTLRAGYSYAWWDPEGVRDAVYWLEDVDAAGTRTLHGPIVPVQTANRAPEVVPAPLLRDLSAGPRVGSRPLPRSVVARAEDGGSSANELASRADALKIAVSEEGLYRIRYNDLLAAGIDPGTLNPLHLQLFADGQESALWFSGDRDGSFDPGDWLAFYGWGRDDTYSGRQIFWLAEGDEPGLRMKRRRAGVPGTQASVATVDFGVVLEEDLGYHAAILNGEEENFFGAVVASQAADHLLITDELDAAGGETTLTVRLQGATQVAHRVAVSLNGLELGQIDFEGQELASRTFGLSSDLLRSDEANVVTLARTSGDAADVSLVESISIDYPRRTVAGDDRLAIGLSFAETGALRIDGFSRPPLPVLDVTDPARPILLYGSVVADGQGYGLALHPQWPAYKHERRLLALAGSAVAAPEMRLNAPSTWNDAANGADLVIVAHASLLPELEPLADLRRGEGLTVAMVDIEDVFDEYSFGRKNPTAIRDFVGRARDAWPGPPSYLLLAGDASYDPRDYLGFGEDLVPTRLVDTATFEAPSDDWLADVDEDGVPELAVGRLPLRTPAEASLVVSKLVDYAAATRDERRAVLVTDIGTPTFADMTRRTEERLPAGVPAETISVEELGTVGARTEILGRLDEGAWLVNFAGHGQIDYWNGDLLNSEDADGLLNTGGDQLSFFTMMNCLNGYFVTPYIDSLGEALLRAPGGAMGVWSSSAITSVGSQHMLMTGFYDRLFADSGATLGEAAAGAKGDLRGKGRNSWIFLGDPTSRLQGE